MREIKLTQGYVALVDDEDYEFLNKCKWQYAKNRNNCYAITTMFNGRKPYTVRMHRLIMNAENNYQVDHIDHNGLNNQKYNLRLCDNRHNRMNSQKFSPALCKYKGVTTRRKKPHTRLRYIARIRVNGKLINLGCFDSDLEAASVYDYAAKNYFGEFANVNFK